MVHRVLVDIHAVSHLSHALWKSECTTGHVHPWHHVNSDAASTDLDYTVKHQRCESGDVTLGKLPVPRKWVLYIREKPVCYYILF